MALPSFFKRNPSPAVPSPGALVDPVQQARVKARQRLIGAAVLVVLGVIGFPLVFETQPRPIPVDIPIEIPRKESAPPLVMRPERTAMQASNPGGIQAEAPRASAVLRDEAVAAVSAPIGRGASRPGEKSSPAPGESSSFPEQNAPTSVAAATDADRTRSPLLGDARPAPAASSPTGRFVVQVGAFSDVAAARDIRRRVERLGLKSYTQVASTSAGNRIRVRVGPFGNREEADKALVKARDAGLPAVVLGL